MADDLVARRYRLLEPLGRGSMSSVWAAEDEELGRRVAVKMLAPTADRQRFEREARAAAALSHPNIVSLYDYGQADGRPFMVLEHLAGGSLEDRLRDGRPLPDADTRRIATDVASGLAHAHARGLVHRDLKPANILFDAEGRAKIADFGIARMRGSGTLTEAGTVLGTAAYLSPEQAGGGPAGPASDVYSFGVILFRLLTGRLPFVSRNAMELVRMHREAAPPAVTDVRRDAPPALAAVATAALAKDPSARPPDGDALLSALRGDRAPAPVLAPAGDETAATQVLRPVRRRRSRALPAALAAAALLAGGAVAAIAVTRGGGSSGGAASVPGLSLPTVPTTPSTSTQARTSTARTTTAATTTAPATTAATTAPATTATAPTTSTVPTTTAATTTAATTTAPVTTATLPATSTAGTTTTVPTTTAGTTTIATATGP
ncbi:MAG TPA: serine/threonine-protein kinase [Gaiellaceae bacterium]|nr:serine/threonine-protein kinase [Gaiellaceae bacterium]